MFFGADEIDKKLSEELKKDLDASKLFVSEDLIQRTLNAVKNSDLVTEVSDDIDGIENVVNIKNTENTKNTKNTKNTGIAENKKYIENKKNIENIENINSKMNYKVEEVGKYNNSESTSDIIMEVGGKSKATLKWIKNIGKIAAVLAVFLLCTKLVIMIPMSSGNKNSSTSEEAKIMSKEKDGVNPEATDNTVGDDTNSIMSDAAENRSDNASNEISMITESSAGANISEFSDTDKKEAMDNGTDVGNKEEKSLTFGAADADISLDKTIQSKSKNSYEFTFEKEEDSTIIKDITQLMEKEVKASVEYKEDASYDYFIVLQIAQDKKMVYAMNGEGYLVIFEYSNELLMQENYYQVEETGTFLEKVEKIIKTN